MIVSPAAAKELGANFGNKPVCAGPFKFVERVQNDKIVLEKFQGYWNKDKSSSTRSRICRSLIRPCAWPTSNPATSTWSSVWRPVMLPR
jgi:ABC-type dipeptide transport system, periplasmic component